MELKQDCIREVLLYLEKNSKLDNYISNVDIKLEGFSQDDITYTIEKLAEGNIINVVSKTFDNEYLIKDITFNGHQFLNTIRDDSVWKETKLRLSKVASVSLPVIQQVASTVLLTKLNLS